MKKIQWSKGEWLILLVVALAFFMRFWPVGYTLFEGHSQEIPTLAYRFIHKGVPPLFGYSFFQFYGHYGPAPVYLYLPFALISPNPLMATFFSAGLSVIAVYVLYRIGRDFWNPLVGWMAALLYASSHFSGVASRIPVTANLAPLFIAVYVYSILALLKERRTLHYVLLFASMGIILQLHIAEFIVLLLLLPAFFLGARINRKSLILGMGILLLHFLPYLYYEASNGFLETRQRLDLITGIGSAGSPLSISIDGTFLRSVVAPKITNQKNAEQNNPFILDVIDLGVFCQLPSDDSLLMARLIPLGDRLLTLAWLMFLIVPFLSIGYLVIRRHRNKVFERKTLILMIFWPLSTLVYQSLLPQRGLHYLNGPLISIILLWSIGWGWLIPSLAGPLKAHFKRVILGFVLLIVVLNTVTWTTAHLSNPQKDCIYNAPSLSAMMKIAEVLVRDQRLRLTQESAENVAPLMDWALHPILSTYELGLVNPGMAYAVQAASHQREQRGEQFLNLTGRYLLIKERSLPFALDPSQETTQTGSFLLVHYEPIINTTHWYIANSEGLLGQEWAQSRGFSGPMPFNMCVGGCPQDTPSDEDCLRCLRPSTAYITGYLGQNLSPRTALVIKSEITPIYMIGEVYLNGDPIFLYNGSLAREEVLLDITNLLVDEQNLLEVLLFVKPGQGTETTRRDSMRVGIFTISGE